MRTEIHAYLSQVHHAIECVDISALEDMTNVLFEAFVSGRSVYTCGNGASAALATHMACDLGKGTAADVGRGFDQAALPRLRITSLADNTALLTAYGNDLDYQDVFLEQLKNIASPGDVVLGISGSGGSPNVLRALAYARHIGARTLSMTGQQHSAYKIRELSDYCLQVSSDMMEQIEDVHVVFSHIIARGLRARVHDFFGDTEHALATPSFTPVIANGAGTPVGAAMSDD